MKTKTVLYIGLATGILCAVASLVITRREAARQVAAQALQTKPDQARNQARPAALPVVEQTAPEQPASPPPATRVKPALPPLVPPSRTPSLNDPATKEQYGRLALSYVGDDPDAEDAWVQVINDPSLSAEARQNLIEDLNEDGLSDPRNPGVQDLPLILNRIALIEELAPDAMDQVNAAAFQEAYKDLVNMAARLTRQ